MRSGKALYAASSKYTPEDPARACASLRDRGTPGEGTCDWDEVYATLAAIGFKGGLAMESFINMPPEVGYGLAVWRPVAENFAEVMDKGLPFLRNKAKQYRLI